MNWFEVDNQGLAKILERRGKSFALFELLSNAWDTEATTVEVQLEPVAGRPLVAVTVKDDDPNGFTHLSHAFTLFADSTRKGDSEKRGRFNLGEKLVLALCDEAKIVTTTGAVKFDSEGRHNSRERTESGSVFSGTMRMTREELAEVETALRTVLPPACKTVICGIGIPSRPVVAEVTAELPTELADAEGMLKRTTRRARVTFHDIEPNETATLYEMGIPVVELTGGERWHVNIHQKVPLNMDRDNVTPSYLQTVRVLLANSVTDKLAASDANAQWLNAATDDTRASKEAVEAMMFGRFGERRAVYDPSDVEASKEVVNRGYTVVTGGALSKGQWDNAKAHGLIEAAGKIAPSQQQYDPDGPPMRMILLEDWSDGMRRVVAYTRGVAPLLIGHGVSVDIANEPVKLQYAAEYGGGHLRFNAGRLGHSWFDGPVGGRHDEVILHEFTHDKVGDHLTLEFSNEALRLASKLVELALSQPDTINRIRGMASPFVSCSDQSRIRTHPRVASELEAP